MVVNPERWQHIKEVFQSAVDLPPVDRFAFLDRACAGDEVLRREVESLLVAEEKPGSFRDSPPEQVATEMVADDRAPLIGKSISHYKILSLLGEGGMGEVYLAQDTKLGRKVALKLLPPSLSNDENRLRRFEREARSASALNHPNVCVIHEIGETDDRQPFIAMEHIDGMTLRHRLRRGPVAINEAIEIASQTGSALAAAHEAGVVHRDIKPENIMLRQDGYAKVLDFGLAKLTERYAVSGGSEARTAPLFNTGSGMLMGTANYLSPEQARREEVDERTDIWSLGIVLYEMLTGCMPFTGETPSHVIVSILENEPKPLTECVARVPAELDRIIEKALQKDRGERYQTAREFTQDLGRLKQTVSSGVVVVRKPGWRQSLKSQYALTLIVGILLVVGIGIYLFRGSKSVTTNSASIDSVAVLPFANTSNDPDMDYLSDGITDSLINNLSQLPNLKVIGRSSTFPFKGKQTDAHAVGQELGVKTVLTGRIVEHNGNLSIYVDLEDARDKSHIWGDQYNRKMADLLVIQDEISHKITEKLRLRMSGVEEQRLAKRPTENVDAYQLYLKGKWYWNRFTIESKDQAINSFQQAIALDPNFALAYSGLADVYVIDSTVPVRESYQKAKAAAERALLLDSSLGEAHATLGLLKTHYDIDWVGGEAEFKKAIELSPNYSMAHLYYADLFIARGNFDQASKELEKAKELDPLSPLINSDFGLTYFYSKDYERAIEYLKGICQRFPDFFPAHEYLAWSYTQKKMYREALAEYKKAIELSPGNTMSIATSAYAQAMSGNRGEAENILRQLESLSKQRNVSPVKFAVVQAGLGHTDQVIQRLEQAREQFDLFLIFVQVHPFFDSLRSDPKFQEAMQRIGLASP